MAQYAWYQASAVWPSASGWEAATKRALIAAAQTTVVLADSTKLDRTSAIRFADLDEVQVLVTDAGIEAPTRARLERAGLQVVVA